jgi:hypothetical protein
MVVMKCRTFKAERRRDEDGVVILGACGVQVSLMWPSWMGMGTMCGCVGTLRVCMFRD